MSDRPPRAAGRARRSPSADARDGSRPRAARPARSKGTGRRSPPSRQPPRPDPPQAGAATRRPGARRARRDRAQGSCAHRCRRRASRRTGSPQQQPQQRGLRRDRRGDDRRRDHEKGEQRDAREHRALEPDQSDAGDRIHRLGRGEVAPSAIAWGSDGFAGATPSWGEWDPRSVPLKAVVMAVPPWPATKAPARAPGRTGLPPGSTRGAGSTGRRRGRPARTRALATRNRSRRASRRTCP